MIKYINISNFLNFVFIYLNSDYLTLSLIFLEGPKVQITLAIKNTKFKLKITYKSI